ncbi:MAG: hypothetical protein ACFFBL_07945, partial [Promethearchaeota archaeon]
ECTALCEHFICERKPPALKIKKQSGGEMVWCTWIDEECDQGWCVHSKCAIRKLSQDGKCKLAQQAVPVQAEVRVRVDEPYPDAMPKDIAKKFRQR